MSNSTFDRTEQGSLADMEEDLPSGERPGRLESPTYQGEAGDVIDGRYKLQSSELLGSGVFATVHAAMDLKTRLNVAIKITRNQSNFAMVAEEEIVTLQRLHSRDKSLAEMLFSELLDYFLMDEHQCLVFPLYGSSVFEFIKNNQYRGFTLKQATHITYQLTAATQYMHHIGLIHTDIKPENLFIVDDSYVTMTDGYRLLQSSFVRLGDFNSTTDFTKDDKNNLVQTKNYRSPEVAAGMTWTEAIDIWSIGCLMYELVVGELLVECEVDGTNDQSDYERKRFVQLCESVTRLMPYTFLDDASITVPDMSTFRQKQYESPTYGTNTNREEMMKKMLWALPSDKDDLDLHYYRLLGQMLVAQPERRITAAEALKHPLFSKMDNEHRFDMDSVIFEQNLPKTRRFTDRLAIARHELRQLNKKKPVMR